MKTIKGLVFDKDGTLFQYTATWSIWAERFFREITDDETVARQVADKLGFDLDSGNFAPDSPIIAETVDIIAAAVVRQLPALNTDQVIDIANNLAENTPQTPVAGLNDTIASLKARGYKLGLATNDAEAPAIAHLKDQGILSHFDFVSGYDSGFGGKPEPGQLLGFCKSVDLAPAECAMVGDSTHDLQAGRNAAMTTVAVLTGMADEATLTPFADVVLPDVTHLPEWLSQSRNLRD